MFKSNGRIIHSIYFFALCILIMLLNGCTTTKKDGPPSYRVDISNIPDAKPKVEKLSKTGNKPYAVFGKRYSVMSSSKNYKERGTASWYGSKFHKRNTSSGERYDMLGMTAAHKSLPLPTYVEVKNLHNGKKVIVKVNDRGPFEQSRLIDLSYAAAKKLGILERGTGTVEVTAIDPSNQLPAAGETSHFATKKVKPVAPHSEAVYLQVGAFHNKTYAQKLQKQLLNLVSSPVKITWAGKPTNLYRVQIGPIHDPMRAASINKQLKSIGLNGKKLLDPVVG